VEGSSTILAGLAAMFMSYVSDFGIPDVVWYTPEPSAMEQELGVTRCGYRTNTATGEKEPFCRIKIHSCLMHNPPELIDTYLHELAHYVDWVSDEDWDNHGGQWKQLTRRWDLVDHHARADHLVEGCQERDPRDRRLHK
jgi:hypothetical protein